MKNKLIILIATFICACIGISAAPPFQPQVKEVQFASYPRELKPLVQMALRIPEVKNLLKRVQQQGPVSIRICRDRNDHFEGYWDGESRTIVIDGIGCKKPGKIISTLIFELHNADTNHKFTELNNLAMNGSIDKETFVRETERIEHQNVLRCSLVVNKAVNNGALPKGAGMPAVRNFDAHYKIQQLTGHSQFLAWCYDRYCPHNKVSYNGTIPQMHQMTEHEKNRLLNQLVSQNLEYPI